MSLISRLEKLEHDCPEMLDRVRELLAAHGSNTAQTVSVQMGDVSSRVAAMERSLLVLFDAIGISPPDPSPPSEPQSGSTDPTTTRTWFGLPEQPPVEEPPAADNSNPEASAPAA